MSTARRLFVVAAILAAFFVGRTIGIYHAITACEPSCEVTTIVLDGEEYIYG